MRLIVLTPLGMPDEMIAGGPFDQAVHKPLKLSQLREALVRSISGLHVAEVGVAPAYRPARWQHGAPVPRILLVEDDYANQELGIRILQQLGCPHTAVGTGVQALAALECDRYDLVLLDVQLPDIDGLQVARRIRQAGDQFGQPYLVALTADTQPSTRAACVSAGMDTYLAKPLQLHDLHTVLAGYHHMVATPPAEARAGASPAPSLGAPAAPALDPETLERLRSLFGPHRERMHALIERFCADTAALPAKLFQAAAANDIEALRLGAHQLKSSSAIVAALPLAALGERLEQLIGTAGLAECPALIARIEQEIVRVQAALKAEFAD